ncbi:tail fiber [uncultured Mediterranean phage uvMED]|nr:tail fiber [uncultured Mediterranean phage uvMED]BAR18545.1 tail fiber [uncultured Mediterranean phage uvMED]BAR37966.1 tail fiber [uncultured Mediterranean phage uvMED]
MAGIKDYSSTAANNTSVGGVSIAEGMLPSNINNAFRAVAADIREWYNDSQWVIYGDGDGAHTFAYASGTSFTVNGANVTAIYEAGRRIKVVASTPGTIFGTISSSSFSTNTTVNVTWDSGNLSSESLVVYIAALSKSNSSIPGGSIGTTQIADDSVSTAKIQADAINGSKIANDSIDSEHYVDGSIDTAHLSADAVDGTKLADDSINSEHYVDGSIDTAHIADSQVTTAKIADDAVTAAKIADAVLVTASEHASHTPDEVTVLTTAGSDARYFRQDSNETITSGVTWSSGDTHVATTQAIDNRIIDLVDDVGGFVPIANELAFPNANPDVNNGAGTLVSIKTLSTNYTSSGSGVITIANGTVGNSTVTINGAENSTTYSSGFGMIVETTTTLNTYTFHRLVPKATEVTTVAAKATEIGLLGTSDAVADMNTLGTSQTVSDMNTLAAISGLNTLAANSANVTTAVNNLSSINNFAEVYRIASSAPTSSLNSGDLYFDTSSDTLKVYGGSGWQNAGSSVNGTSARFKYVATSNQTSFSGSDADGNTLAYDSGYIDVYLNGVHLDPTDYTASSGSSVVLASGAATGDILYIVGFGTFNVAAINAANISSGTLNDARLPTTMAGKTLNTAIVNANTLVARGDGSSADGKITLNCSQNSHGVAIKSPPHSAGQSYTLTLPSSITNGYYLKTDGSGNLSFAEVPQPTVPTVANVSQTIAPASATTVNITGTNFSGIPIVQFIKSDTGAITSSNTVSLTNATTLSVNCTLASGTYYVRIELENGRAARSTNAIFTASTAPSFSTGAGSIGTFAGNFSGTLFTIAGSSDSTVAFSETTSVLTGAGVTLNSSTGALTTSDFGASSTTPTTYTFTIRLTDAEGQTTDREFSMTSSFGATGGALFP